MGLFDGLRGEFIDIVEWIDDSGDTMVYRFQRHDNEIKNGAKLIVREGQVAVFVREGKLADIFEPGTHTLSTRNLPILGTLAGWKHGFDSPFKAEVYFVTTRRFTDLKWGTKNPIMLRDPEFGPVRLRAFGTYVIRVVKPGAFIRDVVGVDQRFDAEDIASQLRNLVVSRFADVIGESKIPVLDLAANYDDLGEFLTGRMAMEFLEYGIELTSLLVENISLPPAVEEALDKRTSMGVIGNLSAYTQFQTAEAITKAADNPGGAAGDGMAMGMGFAMANQMGQNLAGGAGAQGQGSPPPLPTPTMFFVAVDGQQTGPFDMATLQAQVASGRLVRTTLVWKEGMANWSAAGDVPELAALFQATPPPIPPQPPEVPGS